MRRNGNFKFDLSVGIEKENELSDIFAFKKIEVKCDRKYADTNNVFVEYESRGYPSGLATTEADYYCFALGETFHLIKVATLKKLCRKYVGTKRDTVGGDSNTSRGILLPIMELF